MEHDDVRELFEELLKAEQTALEIYVKVLNQVKNEKIKKIIKPIAEDESVHANNAREILRILEEG